MAKVIFGCWDGHIIDNRDRQLFEIEDSPDFQEFDEFDPGNPIRAFMGAKGFFVFARDVSMLDVTRCYIKRAVSESCGKCTPCRMGTRIIEERIEALLSGQATVATLAELETLADHVMATSLCGLGQTATVALLALLRHFRDQLVMEIEGGARRSRRACTTYVTAPCIEACPSKVDVPRYIDYIKDGKFTHSVGVVLQKYPMAATCGRVCVRFCEMACRRTQVDEAVGIKILKRFVSDHERYVTDNWFGPELIENKKPAELKVAVIGAGPAGISAAYHLLLRGYPVDVFEAMTEPGGMAAVGIPEYRLPKEAILRKEVSIIERLGGHIHYNQRLGEKFTLQDLRDRGYKAIFLGVGAQRGKTVGVPGEESAIQGYITGVKFLLFINHYYINLGLPMDLGLRMVVVGGGNVAMDCVRSALRMGVKEVHLVYRRTIDSMPADHEEVEAAQAEGVIFHELTHPSRIITENGKVKGIELVRMEEGDPDASGRRSVRPKEGSHFVLETEFVIPAIGQEVDHRFLAPTDGVTLSRAGLLQSDPNTLATNRPGVFAGGDAVTGPATLIQAMAQGERAARSIDDYLTYGRVRFSPGDRFSQLLRSVRKLSPDHVQAPVQAIYRVRVKELDPEVRKQIFAEVEKPISVAEAYREAQRCMRCYRIYSVLTEK
jgi:formate dehydrogenase beta subunit